MSRRHRTRAGGWRAVGAITEGLEQRMFLSAAADDPAPLVAPTNVLAEPLCSEKITVSFTDSNDTETGYEVQRGRSASGPFVTVGTTPAGAAGETLSFVDLASASNLLEEEGIYYYRVRALGSGDDGPF